MPRSKNENLDDSSAEKLTEVEKKILDSLEALSTEVDTLSSRLVKCDNTGEEIKQSIVECLQTYQASLETSVPKKRIFKFYHL